MIYNLACIVVHKYKKPAEQQAKIIFRARKNLLNNIAFIFTVNLTRATFFSQFLTFLLDVSQRATN